MAPPAAQWLRGGSFDLHFIGTAALLPLCAGALLVHEPGWFAPILVLDLWLLGHPHVVATFTRLCFDNESFRRRRFLVLVLPSLVFVGVAALAAGVGLWAISSVYLYWQWFHYTRQSYGVSQIYRRKASVDLPGGELANRLAFYLVPVWGILHRSHQDPTRFLGVEIRALPVPALAVDLVAAAALASLLWWIVSRARAWWQGRLPVAHTLYTLSHFAIFLVGYIAIGNINHGWLVLNLWHNAQYLSFVWLFNNRRFQGGEAPDGRLFGAISRPGSGWRYYAVCALISAAAYALIESSAGTLALLLVLYQTINFHHYIVDGLIWKVRRPGLRRTLGIRPQPARP